jgi:SAM-dependent methyltransferase
MSGSSPPYVLANAAAAREVERQRHIDEYMGPTTERRLAGLGIAAGWKCLEVGAGAGGVARWMAERVGRSGRVTAIDINPLFGVDPRLPQLEVRQHDVLAEGLEEEAYDLVHCRVLLIHVGNVELALQRMKQALRPGGWLIVEEPGESRAPGVGESDLRVAEFNRLNELFLESVSARASTVEMNLFRRLPALMEDLELVALGGEVTNRLVDHRGRAALLGTVTAVRPLLADTAFVKEGKIDRLVELCADPTLLTLGGSTLALWGQRAAPAPA